jgi:hypothetical protein
LITAFFDRRFLPPIMMLIALLGCDRQDIDGLTTPSLQITPGSLTFPKLVPGESDTQQLELRNDGSGDLLIASISLTQTAAYAVHHGRTPDGERVAGLIDGLDQFDYPLRVPAGAALYLDVTLTQQVGALRPDALVLLTNLADSPERVVPLTQSTAGVEINVSPTTLDFGRVRAGEAESAPVTITNLGQLPLMLHRLTMSGSQDFAVELDGADPRRQVDLLDDPDGDGEPGLAPNASITLTVTYAPVAAGPDQGTLSIFSNDDTRPEVVVDLSANGASPCLDVEPGAIEYRTSLINRTDARPLNLISCGGAALRIDEIRLSDDSDPAFTLAEDALPDLPAEMPAAVPDAPLPSRGIRVEFTPRETRVHEGWLLIVSNALDEPSHRVSLLGRGVENACPVARAIQDEYAVAPLDVITLDGSPSIDPDGPNGQPVAYEWVVIDSPEGSLSQPFERFFDAQQPANGGEQDHPATPTAQFFVDLAGTYVLELRVRDNLGLSSTDCETSQRVVIEAVPDQAILVQLTWETPGDADETDTDGADLDLHLLHPNANSWFQSPYDCFYQNPQPDWGQLDNPADDPTLDIDDVNGAGPENISLDQPENTDLLGAPYLVGVHSYRTLSQDGATDFGPSKAVVRIFVDGELAWDFTEDDGPGHRVMQAADHFWDVAAIEWPSRRITTRNRYSTQRP